MVNKKKIMTENTDFLIVCSKCGQEISQKDCKCQEGKGKNEAPRVGWNILKKGT